jgi:Replication-relaxation
MRRGLWSPRGTQWPFLGGPVVDGRGLSAVTWNKTGHSGASGVSGSGSGERAVLQLLFTAEAPRAQAHMQRLADQLSHGKTRNGQHVAPTVAERARAQRLAAKAARPLFAVSIRVFATAPDRAAARRRVGAITSGLHGFATGELHLMRRPAYRWKRFVRAVGERRRVSSPAPTLLNTDELTAMLAVTPAPHQHLLHRAGTPAVRRRRGHPARPARERGTTFVLHSLAVTQCLVDVSEYAHQRSGVRVISCLGEPDCHVAYVEAGRPARLTPDALCEVQVNDELIVSALEIDRGTEGLRTLLHKAARYIGYAGRYPECPQVVWVFTSHERAHQFASAIRRAYTQPATRGLLGRGLFVITTTGHAAAALCGEATS